MVDEVSAAEAVMILEGEAFTELKQKTQEFLDYLRTLTARTDLLPLSLSPTRMLSTQMQMDTQMALDMKFPNAQTQLGLPSTPA